MGRGDGLGGISMREGLGSFLGRGLGHTHDGGGRVRVREEERQPMQTGGGGLRGFLGMSLESAQILKGRGEESQRNRWRNVL